LPDAERRLRALHINLEFRDTKSFGERTSTSPATYPEELEARKDAITGLGEPHGASAAEPSMAAGASRNWSANCSVMEDRDVPSWLKPLFV
jgi:hypothetical protein